MRYKSARKLGLTELPVVLFDHWTEGQVKAFRLLVNRSVTWPAKINLPSVVAEKRAGFRVIAFAEPLELLKLDLSGEASCSAPLPIQRPLVLLFSSR